MKKPLRYFFWWPVRTFDTFEADTPPVMQVARNVYGTLVSDFIDGKVEGIIARDWTIDPSGRIWKFHIRPGLKFDNGKPITAELVLANYRRILWLTRKEGLVLNSLLPEVAAWTDYSKPLHSLRVEGDALVFEFKTRPVSLFEAISQPIYGVADPACWDEHGKWKDAFTTSASGQYRVTSREANRVSLESRHVFHEVENAPEKVEIIAPADPSDNVVKAVTEGRGDLTVEHSFALSRDSLAKLGTGGLRVSEEPPVRMHFLHLNAQRGPLRDAELRRSIRDGFLDALRKDARYRSAGPEVDASFIPRGGVGYRSFEHAPPAPFKKAHGEKLEVLFYPLSGDPGIQGAIEDAVVSVLKAHGLDPQVTRYPERFEAFNRMRKGEFDAVVRGTGVLINNPYGDLRMMFLSTVGARIPDLSGQVPGWIEAAEHEADPKLRAKYVEKINDSVFDQASIITFAHSRLFYLQRPGVDLSRHNLFSDPIEFRAVGWKP